jgi:hypothetical protein
MWLLPLALGFLLGGSRSWAPRTRRLVRHTGLASLLVLLFFLGARTGADDKVQAGFASIGARAAVVAVGATGASIGAGALYGRRWLRANR